MVMAVADMAVGRTIIIQRMDNTTAAVGFQTHLLRAVAFMDGKSKTVYIFLNLKFKINVDVFTDWDQSNHKIQIFRHSRQC